MIRVSRGGFGAVVCAAGAVVALGCGSSASPASTSGGGNAGAAVGGNANSAGGAGLSGASTSGGTNSSLGGSGGSGGSVAGAGQSGGAQSGGGAPAATFVSVPTQTLVVHAGADGQGLTLLSSQVRQTTGTLNYVDWFGELRNDGTTTRCLVKLVGNFEDSGGLSIEQLTSYPHAKAYRMTGSTETAPCLAPGDIGIVWSNDLPETPITLDSIATLDLTITSLDGSTAIIDPLNPTVGPLTKTLDSLEGDWTVSGDATAASGTIYNVELDVWGKSGNFYVDTQEIYHLDDFLPGTLWHFDTAPLGLKATTLDSVAYTYDYIEGSNPSPKVVGGTSETSPAAAETSLALANQQAARARRARWLGN